MKKRVTDIIMETLIEYGIADCFAIYCRIVAFSRCLVIKCRMAPLKVVGVDILSNSSSSFLNAVVLC